MRYVTYVSSHVTTKNFVRVRPAWILLQKHVRVSVPKNTCRDKQSRASAIKNATVSDPAHVVKKSKQARLVNFLTQFVESGHDQDNRGVSTIPLSFYVLCIHFFILC